MLLVTAEALGRLQLDIDTNRVSDPPRCSHPRRMSSTSNSIEKAAPNHWINLYRNVCCCQYAARALHRRSRRTSRCSQFEPYTCLSGSIFFEPWSMALKRFFREVSHPQAPSAGLLPRHHLMSGINTVARRYVQGDCRPKQTPLNRRTNFGVCLSLRVDLTWGYSSWMAKSNSY